MDECIARVDPILSIGAINLRDLRIEFTKIGVDALWGREIFPKYRDNRS